MSKSPGQVRDRKNQEHNSSPMAAMMARSSAVTNARNRSTGSPASRIARSRDGSIGSL
jgi:hypothetical protein